VSHDNLDLFQVPIKKMLKTSPSSIKLNLFRNHIHYLLNVNYMVDHTSSRLEMTKTLSKPHVEKDPQFNVSP